ncbi:MAG TPA: capsular polysaccharide biosynthesis protein [Candidatus Ignatzschineria merdigallinarum]|uniref:Capsular polysaccharide biosynthesis protein n=1 Tax=Candidatus Ignatzschineria merdigallinarum TaxID=2838621 RepID=A0A9D1Q6A4_9GAMM|nr:capsular polysaccharide biosynthesis protein [Candidatus Ignatzschineria merdigallinarum]
MRKIDIQFSSNKLSKTENVRTILQDEFAQQVSFSIGWGNKPNTKKARAYAEKHELPFIALEDGFLRSMDLGVNGEDPLSLVVDDLGIYYDTTKASRLEEMILNQSALANDLMKGERALKLVIEHRLTKYNHVLEGWPAHLEINLAKPQVLVIDQTFGDMSLEYGSANFETFQTMLQAAIAENPDAEIWIKVHPDVLAGKKQGHYSALIAEIAIHPERYPQIHILAENIHPHSLIEKMDRVYVATSQMGFEALMLGKEVITFGVPWYAGWGLTEDRNPLVNMPAFQDRRRQATFLELFTASYLQYCRYINPFTQERGTIFEVIDYLVMMKRRERLLQGEIWIVGLSWWKRKIMSPFLKTVNNQLRFFKTEAALKKAFHSLNALNKSDHSDSGLSSPSESQLQLSSVLRQSSSIRLLLWGKKFPALESLAKSAQLPVLRMEDGFIRSVGLGSNLVAPRSLVIDDEGIYFDAGKPSRLERILEETRFTTEMIAEADQLKKALVAAKVGKYNVGNSTLDLQLPNDQRILLVPGQVEDDASIQTGTRDIKTNLGLLQYVRAHNPEAYIIYKPHPDVVSGNRVGDIPEAKTLQYADTVMAEADIIVLMEVCDELHTMTSLSGFEALLRDKKVFCYGIPFYAGWGLTTDLYRLENRRKRRLTLPELIAGTLLLYPEYLDTKTGKLTNANVTLAAIAKERLQMQNQRLKTNWPMRKWQQLRGLMRTLKW